PHQVGEKDRQPMTFALGGSSSFAGPFVHRLPSTSAPSDGGSQRHPPQRRKRTPGSPIDVASGSSNSINAMTTFFTQEKSRFRFGCRRSNLAAVTDLHRVQISPLSHTGLRPARV